ncbi:MAG: SurA N-terminal domain-containing protein [Proteobacteria bacterium]|nr:SurA N-terminal domain-containing protein [Pseudomonadota bacterium]MBU1387695.1 SurA N-terminal domain-containing protein [Pseudomonadota bacterium]MBU1543727.1 SurA N-terminal domain-containing protein [Pseudomonadota bacterium]MBU2482210.1 SurA N-terminal domain-containing protein [Pseudomonadota bacterium]
MLRYLRENTGNWIIKIFLGIIVIVFVFLGVGSFSKRNDSVATIDDEPITIKEYRQAYDAIVAQHRARYGDRLNDELLQLLNVKQQALDTLIDQKVMMKQADKLNITVSEKELQDSLLSEKAFQQDGKFNIDLYKNVLNRNSLNPEIFEQRQMNALRMAKMRDMVLGAINVSDIEARDWYIYQNTKISVNYLLFTADQYKDIAPDEKQIKAYYAQNQDKYKSEAKVKASYIKFSPQDYKADVNITDDQIQAFYQQQISKYQIPERVEARHILIRVGEQAPDSEVNDALKKAKDIFKKASEGNDFQKLAQQYSEDSSKEKGGYLGIFAKDSMVEPFGDKAFSLKAGEIGEPVRTQFGWHIIKVIAKFDAATQNLEQVSGDIKNELESTELRNLAYDKASEAFDAVIDGDDFEQVALIANKKIQKTDTFDITGKGLSVANSRGFARAAFDLPLDTISDVKQFGEDYYLIKVDEKIDPQIQDLGIVVDLVRKDLAIELRMEQAQKDAQKALAKAVDAADTKDLTQTAQDFKLDMKTTQLFSRAGNAENMENSSEFIQAGFSLTKENQIYPEVIETPKGYYIIGLKQIEKPKEAQIVENLKSVKDELLWKKSSIAFESWLTELKKNYEIDYDPNILN